MLENLGEPFRVGVDGGDPSWTYGYYRLSLFGGTLTKDLVIRFDASGRVKNWTLNTGFPEEKRALEPALKELGKGAVPFSVANHSACA